MKLAAIASLALTVALAGCAVSTDEYVDDVNAIQERVIDASNSVGSDINASKQEVVKSLEQAKKEAEAAIDDLREVDVPDDAEAGHDQLVNGFEELEKLYTEVREGIESGAGGDAFDELRAEGAEIDRKIDKALDQINQDLGLE
jgi:hypothetical protein